MTRRVEEARTRLLFVVSTQQEEARITDKTKMKECLENEEWRKVRGYEDRYEVSNCGRIRNARTKRVRKPHTRPTGYQTVSARTGDGRPRSISVHRAVLEAFEPVAKFGELETHHRNFNPRDNRRKNLEWVTKTENLRHTWRAGRQRAANRKRSRLMRERHAAGEFA